MAKPEKSRITIVIGDYTIQTFEIGKDTAHAPYDLLPFDKIQLCIKTHQGKLRVTAVDNDPDHDLKNGVVTFRIPSEVSSQLPAGRWPFDVQLFWGTQRTTPIKGIAVATDDVNKS